MTYVAHEEKRGSIRLRIIADEDPTNPRKEFDHSGTMLCSHRRYDLSDKNAESTIAAMIENSRDYRPSWSEGYDAYDFSDIGHLWEMIQKCSDIIALPCYLYDHSGLSMSTGAFSCPWDSGQVGFIAIDKATILETYCKPQGSRLSAALKAKAYKLLEAEVNEFDQYLRGDVYGFVVDRANGDDLECGGDSCWGFYGLEYATREGQEALEHLAGTYPALASAAPDEDDDEDDDY